ncbi:MAG: IS66 family transposase [Deltaproteobacteria bacterium]|nr:IS66 family transposase [Deltaproteobacteria bacterium]
MTIEKPYSQSQWLKLPSWAKQYVVRLEETAAKQQAQIASLSLQILEQGKKIDDLAARLNQNSTNSSKPSSTDNPYQKPKKVIKRSGRKQGGQEGHPGHEQKLLSPTETIKVMPSACECGNDQFDPDSMESFYTHQEIELPEIKMEVTHFILHQTVCRQCGKIVKATLPKGHHTGYGPRFSASAELSGTQGNSRRAVQEFINSVFRVPISLGAIQKNIDRTSEAIKPIYDRLGRVARKARINHIDETSWYLKHQLVWLWVMVNSSAAYFMVQKHRAKEAFLSLIKEWTGILVSDNYGVYRNWVSLRQTCLSHLIRRAKGLAEQSDQEVSRFGQEAQECLQLLCSWAKDPPGLEEWNSFYARFIELVFAHNHRQDKAGVFARLLIKEIDSLWVFLEVQGVDPTNNLGERTLRFGVLWRKRTHGTQSEKGNRWVERMLSIKQTCRMKKVPTFPILVKPSTPITKGRNLT